MSDMIKLNTLYVSISGICAVGYIGIAMYDTHHLPKLAVPQEENTIAVAAPRALPVVLDTYTTVPRALPVETEEFSKLQYSP